MSVVFVAFVLVVLRRVVFSFIVGGSFLMNSNSKRAAHMIGFVNPLCQRQVSHFRIKDPHLLAMPLSPP